MKTQITNRTKFFLAIIIIFMLSGSSLYAYEELRFTEAQIDNIIEGIKSENEGVKKCSIYLAGKFKIEETIDALVTALESETDPPLILAIVFSLYQIDEHEAMMTVLDYATRCKDESICKMLILTAVEFSKNNNQFVMNAEE